MAAQNHGAPNSILSFPSLAALRAYDAASTTTGLQASTAGYYAPGDEGGTTFYWSADSTAKDNGGTVIQPSGGQGRWLATNTSAVNVRAFGARGDDKTDDSAPINVALATANADDKGGSVIIPRGAYLVASDLHVPARVRVKGDGIDFTTIHVPFSANLSQGVFVFGSTSCALSDFVIKFDQPPRPTAVSELTKYKPAVWAHDTTNFNLLRLGIYNAWDGIENIGGGHSLIDDLRISAFHIGIQFDNCRDTIRVNNAHFWVYGMTGSARNNPKEPSQLQLLINTSDAVGIKAQRIDGLMISNSLCIWPRGLDLSASGPGNPWVFATNTDFDSAATVTMSAGIAQFSNCGFTRAHPVTSVTVTGGTLHVSNCDFSGGHGAPFVTLSGKSTALITSSTFHNGGSDDSDVIESRAGFVPTLQLVGNKFFRPGNRAYTKPVIDIQEGAYCTITSNRITDKGSGAGTFVSAPDDSFSTVAENIAPGWRVTGSSGRRP
ncbi:MAG: glycosyl hydrolase family 28-related protein [Chthoniobacterales bacterium]